MAVACPVVLASFKVNNKLMKEKISKLNKGFTLIEVMIVVTLFSIIMIIGTGAVLNSNNVYRKTEHLRTIIDNLHFVMEDMSRSIRTGEDYHCDSTVPPLIAPLSCSASAGSFSFKAVDGSQITYGIGGPGCSQNCKIYKNIQPAGGSQGPDIQMSVDGIEIDGTQSGFLVVGAEAGDSAQPRVLIRLSGKIINPKDNTAAPFDIQTSVSQRNIDS